MTQVHCTEIVATKAIIILNLTEPSMNALATVHLLVDAASGPAIEEAVGCRVQSECRPDGRAAHGTGGPAAEVPILPAVTGLVTG